MSQNFTHNLAAQLAIVLVLAITSGCASVYEPPAMYGADQEEQVSALSSVAESEAPPEGDTSAIRQKASRKIHHDGRIELLVTNTRTTIKKIVDLVNTRNGYVQRISNDTVTVQVPANAFDAAFQEILTFGKVLQKLVTMVDITDQYRSTELRLKIAKTTRERLMALLAKASTEEDKLQLLKQIEEITATIEALESQFELLKTKVNYSTITVELKTHNQFDSRYSDFEPLGFYWINSLAPLDDSIARKGDKLEFKEPAGMLHIKDNKQYWSVESGDKAVFRATRINNKPKGEKEFWLSAIKLRLSPKYRSAESIRVGDYELLRLESYDAKPRIYYVGIRVDKDKLNLVELYFPQTTLEEKYKNNIFNSIQAGEI